MTLKQAQDINVVFGQNKKTITSLDSTVNSVFIIADSLYNELDTIQGRHDAEISLLNDKWNDKIIYETNRVYKMEMNKKDYAVTGMMLTLFYVFIDKAFHGWDFAADAFK